MPQELYRIDHDKFRACVDKWDLPSRVADMCKINRQTMYLVYNKKQLTVSKEFLDKWEINSPFTISQILASPDKKKVYLKQRKIPRETTRNHEQTTRNHEQTTSKLEKLKAQLQDRFIGENTDVIQGIRRNINQRMDHLSFELKNDVSELVLDIVYQSIAFGMEAVRLGFEEPLEQQLAKFYSVRSFRGKRY